MKKETVTITATIKCAALFLDSFHRSWPIELLAAGLWKKSTLILTNWKPKRDDFVQKKTEMFKQQSRRTIATKISIFFRDQVIAKFVDRFRFSGVFFSFLFLFVCFVFREPIDDVESGDSGDRERIARWRTKENKNKTRTPENDRESLDRIAKSGAFSFGKRRRKRPKEKKTARRKRKETLEEFGFFLVRVRVWPGGPKSTFDDYFLFPFPSDSRLALDRYRSTMKN